MKIKVIENCPHYWQMFINNNLVGSRRIVEDIDVQEWIRIYSENFGHAEEMEVITYKQGEK
jgi:hypothetical protein